MALLYFKTAENFLQFSVSAEKKKALILEDLADFVCGADFLRKCCKFDVEASSHNMVVYTLNNIYFVMLLRTKYYSLHINEFGMYETLFYVNLCVVYVYVRTSSREFSKRLAQYDVKYTMIIMKLNIKLLIN